MTFIKELGYDPVLGARICMMMGHLQQTNDPRYRTLLEIRKRAWATADASSHPGNVVNSGDLAVFSYVERNHIDLYMRIQTSRPELD